MSENTDDTFIQSVTPLFNSGNYTGSPPAYQENTFAVLDAIGVDVTRKRTDITSALIIKTPPVLVF